MSVICTPYEDWGSATGSPAVGANRTAVTNLNLMTISNPANAYYLNDVPRPQGLYGYEQSIYSYTRWISFNFTGAFTAIKNVSINIPQAFVSNNWSVNYKLDTNYVAPQGLTNEFGRYSGAFDGTLIPLTSTVTLWPFLDTTGTGPQVATSRAVRNTGSNVWTQWLVLQFALYPGAWNDVANYGAETVTVSWDEAET